MPFTHYRTRGVFLKKEDKGESDQLFTIFTKDFGKVEILGRAIRKIKSKLRAGAELFYFSEIEFIQGKTYKTLTDAILIDKFKTIRKNVEKLEIAYKISDALDSLTGLEEDKKIWQLLLKTFRELNQIATYNLQLIIYYYFLWNLFSILGYSPQIYHCPACGKKLRPETFFFVPDQGGVICWQCLKELKREKNWENEKTEFSTQAQRKMGSLEIDVNVVKILRFFLEKDLEIIKRLKIERKEIENLREVSEIELSFLKEGFSKIEN